MQDRHSVWDVGAVSGCTRKHAHFLPVLDPFLINSDTLSTLQYREPAKRMPKGILCIRFAGSQYRSVLSVSELIKKGSNTVLDPLLINSDTLSTLRYSYVLNTLWLGEWLGASASRMTLQQ